MKIGRNDSCPCGSGLKYKKCCMSKNVPSNNETQNISIEETLKFLEFGLKNINSVDGKVSNIEVKKIELLNNKTLVCKFYAQSENSIDVKVEISTVMGALHGFFKDDSFKNFTHSYYGVRAYDKSDTELMYALSSLEAAELIGTGKALEWMKMTLFQENTKDYRLGIAKRQISEIENALRFIIVDRLSFKYGTDWFKQSLGSKLFENIKGVYKNQFEVEIEDGNVLIEYTFVLQLKKIICTNWRDFLDLFSNKIRFEEAIVELNEVRREEAHNRDIKINDLEKLNSVYEFLLLGIIEKYPNIIPTYLIDNWKIQLKDIMLPKPDLPYSDSDIFNELDQEIKMSKSVANLQGLINHIKDKETKLNSVVVPIQKRKTHSELLEIITNYRTLHEELLDCGISGNLSSTKQKQEEIDVYSVKLHEFSEKYVYEES